MTWRGWSASPSGLVSPLPTINLRPRPSFGEHLLRVFPTPQRKPLRLFRDSTRTFRVFPDSDFPSFPLT